MKRRFAQQRRNTAQYRPRLWIRRGSVVEIYISLHNSHPFFMVRMGKLMLLHLTIKLYHLCLGNNELPVGVATFYTFDLLALERTDEFTLRVIIARVGQLHESRTDTGNHIGTHLF